LKVFAFLWEMTTKNLNCQMATLDELIANVLPRFLAPIPCRDTLRDWFDKAKIPRLKANPTARRGGGRAYYSITHVEKLLEPSAAKNP
jgi:hypothetical protein